MKYYNNIWLLVAPIITVSCLISSAVAGENSQFTLNNVLGTPDWFSISGQHRSRFENLDNQYRAGRNGGDQALLFRTLVLAEFRFDPINFGFEMQECVQFHNFSE